MRHALFVTALFLATACSAPRPVAVAVHATPQSRVATLGDGDVDIAGALAGGRSVLLVFWQPWCASCLAEGPALGAAARERADEWLVVGIVSGTDRDVDDGEVRAKIARHGMTYAHVRDRDLAWSDAFEVTGTPTLVALKPDGSEGWRGHRPPSDWSALHRALLARE